MNQEAAYTILGLTTIALTVFVIARVVLLIIARWRIYTKAGERGWKSLIPFYSDYVEWRIGWKKTGLFWLAALCVIAGWFIAYSSGMIAVNNAGQLVATGNTSMMGYAGFGLILFAAILKLVATYKLFASFGHGIGWLIGYFFVPSIMLLILGFGSSRYHGARN